MHVCKAIHNLYLSYQFDPVILAVSEIVNIFYSHCFPSLVAYSLNHTAVAALPELADDGVVLRNVAPYSSFGIK